MIWQLGSEGGRGGRGWETDVAFSHQKFDGEGKEDRHSWSGVSGSVSAVWDLYSSKEGALKMQESWGPQEVRYRTKIKSRVREEKQLLPGTPFSGEREGEGSGWI